MKTLPLIVVCAMCFWSTAMPGRAQEAARPEARTATEGGLQLAGDFPKPQRLSAGDFNRLPRAEIRVKDPHDGGKEIVYSGVLLTDVLKAGGLTADPSMAAARETVKSALLVDAADGYRAVFALAELDPTIGDRSVLVANTRDGQPLSDPEGKWRLVVPGDKRPARWVRQVTKLTLRRD